MTNILSGKPVVMRLKEEIKNRVEIQKSRNIIPKMAILRVGRSEDDIAYEKSIVKGCNSVGIETKIIEMSIDITIDKIKESIININNDDSIHGILIFRPLPKHLDENEIASIIDPKKDIDCMTPFNLGMVFKGDKDCFAPCTAVGVVELLKYYDIPLIGANIILIGSSIVVGKPLSMLLLREKATVTLCNSKTKNLSDLSKRADIVIAALGRGRFVTSDFFSEGAVAIDVGINDDGHGGICGDIDYENVLSKVSAITPVPGGVGTITTAVLMKQLIFACEKFYN